MGKTNWRKRDPRYHRKADSQTIHPDTRSRWPRRWLLFGARVMPVLIYIRAQAHLHSTMQKRLNRAGGEKVQAERLLDRAKRNAVKTQAYIVAMKGRLEEAAAEGLTVAEWLDRDRAAAREHRSSQHNEVNK